MDNRFECGCERGGDCTKTTMCQVQDMADEIERLNGLVALQKKDMKVAMDRVAELEGALRPFSQPDLCLRLGGNSPREGSSAVVFQRNKAILRLADFDAAKQALGGDDE